MVSLRYADTIDEIDAVEPLWNALQEHHARITPDLGAATPKRDLEDAWRMRRSKYERWLEAPDTFFLIAEQGGEAVGYAFVTVGSGYSSWRTGERVGSLETLSVVPGQRGSGAGAALLEEVWSRLAERGVEELTIVTTKTNVDAHRFYERHGFRQGFVMYYGRSPDPRSG